MASQNQTPPTNEIDLSTIKVTDENVSLNLLVQFIQVAHKRGAFNIQESAKIWECIQVFQNGNQNKDNNDNNVVLENN